MSQYYRQPAKPVKGCANPVIEQWLVEWKDEATAINSKMQYVYAKALKSLRKYPGPLGSGRECEMLMNFGKTLRRKIDARIEENPGLIEPTQGFVLASPVVKKAVRARAGFSSQDEDEEDMAPKKRAKKREYVPAYRSGAYAILVTMYNKEQTPNYRGYMLKSEIQQEAQEHCDTSLITCTKGAYNGWSAMKSLMEKGLAFKRGQPVQYMLTGDGKALAAKLLNANSPQKENRNNQNEDDTDEADADIDEPVVVPRVRLNPGEFEVILCVDAQETAGKSKKAEVLGELRKNDVRLEVMKLNIGDFVWIIRKKQSAAGPSNRRLTISHSSDMVLPYVVERKRTDDLANSIKDGRFSEQKLRLEQTGLQPIYLVESYGSPGSDFGLAEGALPQAVANTQVTNGFMIHETDSIKDTCSYLTNMTRILWKMYQGKRVLSCTKEEWPALKAIEDETYLMSFNDFNEFGTKARNWTVSQMFARQLMKLRYLSAEKAFAIIRQYPTVSHLFNAYRDCASAKDRESLLASLRVETGNRTIGPAISKAIYMLYSSHSFDNRSNGN